MEQLRAFIAVELSTSAVAVLRVITKDLLVLIAEDVRWLLPEGIHLPLKFRVNIGSDSVVPIPRAMSRCATSFAPFHLCLRELGAFPNMTALRVIWIGPHRTQSGGRDGFLSLQVSMEYEMESLVYIREERSFSPHLTIGRTTDGIPASRRREIGENLDAFQ